MKEKIKKKKYELMMLGGLTISLLSIAYSLQPWLGIIIWLSNLNPIAKIFCALGTVLFLLAILKR